MTKEIAYISIRFDFVYVWSIPNILSDCVTMVVIEKCFFSFNLLIQTQHFILLQYEEYFIISMKCIAVR